MLEHNEDYQLEKLIWTEADFEKMGWHDAKVYAIGFDSENYKIMFDIDYIYAWVKPAPNTVYYSFWVSPCTLVFENIYESSIEIDPSHKIEILDIIREDVGTPPNSEFINKKKDWSWILECTAGHISFRSIGYTQYTRKKPQHSSSQSLSLGDRGGVGFNLL